jgi:DNA-binding XRE family transcriptional regulator
MIINDELYETIKANFSAKIIELRKTNNLTQKQLGEIAGTRTQAVSNWEKCLFMPSLEAVINIAKHFKTPIDSFLYWE